MNDVGLNQIKQLVSRYQIINKEDLKKMIKFMNMTFDKDAINKFFSELNISYADISQSNIILFPILFRKG